MKGTKLALLLLFEALVFAAAITKKTHSESFLHQGSSAQSLSSLLVQASNSYLGQPLPTSFQNAQVYIKVKAPGSYVSVNSQQNGLLQASATSVGTSETFGVTLFNRDWNHLYFALKGANGMYVQLDLSGTINTLRANSPTLTVDCLFELVPLTAFDATKPLNWDTYSLRHYSSQRVVSAYLSNDGKGYYPELYAQAGTPIPTNWATQSWEVLSA